MNTEGVQLHTEYINRPTDDKQDPVRSRNTIIKLVNSVQFSDTWATIGHFDTITTAIDEVGLNYV